MALTSGQKVAKTRRLRTAGRKAATTRRRRAAAKKASRTRIRRAAARKAAASRKRRINETAAMPITQDEFESTIRNLPVEPTRSQLYEIGLRMIRSDFEIEAYLLILATWNFAYFRYGLREFDLNRFRDTIMLVNPLFEALKPHSFETANFDLLADDIRSIYSQLKPFVKQTGASKIMHFKHPNLFVMWDKDIRSYYHVPTASSAQNYLDFLRLMRAKFGHLRWTGQDSTFARGIDLYNFAVAHR
jgi:hypothetical protein